jgi:Fe-S-cluster-containing hydrogenase component 2
MRRSGLREYRNLRFRAISINPATKLAEICDQCETVEGGPQCVIWCPKEALSLTNPDRQAQKTRRELIKESLEFPMKTKEPR